MRKSRSHEAKFSESCESFYSDPKYLKAAVLLDILRVDPFQNPPPYEKLIGDLSGAYSRRINIQHRLVYQVLKDERIVKVLRLWTHYE